MHAEYDGDSSACLSFMEPDAFRYYLPCFMLLSLEYYTEADAVVTSLVSRLTPSYPVAASAVGYLDPLGRGKAPFSLAERQAIATFLLAMQELHGDDLTDCLSPAIALRRYWMRYLPEPDRARVHAFSEAEIQAMFEQRDAEVAELRRKYGDVELPD